MMEDWINDGYSPENKKNIPALTSIRGFAAIAVVLMHINSTYAEQGLLFFSLFQYSSLGVDLFFILSGFILAYVYEEQNFSKLGIKSFFVTFMSARLARIYPLHIVTLLFTLLIVLTLSGFSERYSEHFFTLQSFILNVFLIQNWGLVDISWNTVSWSISAEFFMYLLFPFMLYFKSFINNTNHIIMLTLLCFVAHHLFIFVLDWSSYGGMSLGGMVRVFFEFSLGFLFFS